MKVLLSIVAVLITIDCCAQIGDVFPNMSAETLDHQTISLPSDLKGKYSLLILASSKKAEEYLNSWYNPVYNNFIREKNANNLFDFTYDIHCYFVPMITGAKKVGYKKVMKESEKGMDGLLKPHVLFYEGTLKTYTKALNLEGKKVPYFFVLDPTGKIIDAKSGPYTDQKMQEVINAVKVSLKH